MEVLARSDRAAAHAARLDPYVQPHLGRRRRGIKHPVHDFMFEYYSFKPAHLLRWHPGYPDVSPEEISDRRVLIETLLRLLRATAGRDANFGCFGMHEWAMVYRLPADHTRHSSWPLRLGSGATNDVVDRHKIACSHFDAYRFFTDAAAPLNTLSPTSDNRPLFEQPGCLHGNMDLYKHAFRLSPLVPSDLIADAFELAWDIRIMDMRAAPYDLTGVTFDPTGDPWTPIHVETAEGKREYAALQRRYAERAAPIRQELVDRCEQLHALT